VSREKILKSIHFLALYLFWPAIALVVWGELSKEPAAVENLVWDKALHFTAYFGLSGMICLVLKNWRRTLVAAISLILFGGALEIIQGFTGRDPSFYDELANTIGVLAGFAAGQAILWLLTSKSLAATRPR